MSGTWDDNDEGWQEMPVVSEARRSSDDSSSGTDDAGPSGASSHSALHQGRRAQRRKRRSEFVSSRDVATNPTTNATGRSLRVDDARGYDWRAKPKGLGDGGAVGGDSSSSDAGMVRRKSDPKKTRPKRPGVEELDSDDDDEAGSDAEDEGGARGYTQLRLDEDVEGEELHAATDYLFGGGSSGAGGGAAGASSGATPLSQLATTKQLLSEGQKIAYVGLVSLVAKNFVRALQRVPGKELEPAIRSSLEWRLKVMARLYQHMDIDASEQGMIDSLADHGVLPQDLAPSLITTQTIDNPDFDPEAEKERAEERAEEARQEAQRRDEEAFQQEEAERRKARAKKERDSAERMLQNQGSSTGGSVADPNSPSTGPGSDEPSQPSKEAVTPRPALSLLPPSPRQSEDLDGDIGAFADDAEEDDAQERRGEDALEHGAPPPPYSRTGDAEADVAATEGDLGGAESGGAGEAGAGAKTPVPSSPATPVVEKKAELATPDADVKPLPGAGVSVLGEAEGVSSSGRPAEAEDDAAKATLAAALVRPDPNTAAQAGLQAETDAKVTPLGLTSASQKIETMPSALDGVTTELSSADRTITLDLRWTVLCDLFLVLTADSVYDARSRVLLEAIAAHLGLHWMDVTKFEKRVTDALEIEEGVAGSLKSRKAVRRRAEATRRRRMVMMGLATVGGGLVIGLSAGLLAPVIGAGLGAALGTIGIGGTTGFLGGVGGATIITTAGTAGGMAIGGQSMNRRTRSVRTFEFRPLHANKRVNCIVTMPGFMSGAQDDPRLPFSVLDSIMGDVFSVLWEPDMMQEMGNAMSILWNETIAQGVQHVLAATIAGGLVGALAWPLWLTKLGYLIDNPWSNALDRAHAAGLILADVLARRQLGVRPITLVGFSLGARAIFYALVELARQGKFGVVQNVYLLGAPVTASDKVWKQARGVVAGRFVNAFSRTDWILGYLFRATTGGLRSIAGLHPVERVQDLENVDVTRTIPGHLYYRAFMPLVLDELGFRCTADYFDEPEDLANIPEREVVEGDRLVQKEKAEERQELKAVKTKTGGFGMIFRKSKSGTAAAEKSNPSGASAPSTPSASRPVTPKVGQSYEYDEESDDGLPRREPDDRSHSSTAEGLKPAAGAATSAKQGPVPTGREGIPSTNHPEVTKSPNTSTMAPGTRSSVPTRLAGAATSSNASRPVTPEVNRPSSDAVHFDTDQILRELRESGIEVRELESSLPTLTVQSSPPPSRPGGKGLVAAEVAAPGSTWTRTSSLARERTPSTAASISSTTTRSSSTPASSYDSGAVAADEGPAASASATSSPGSSSVRAEVPRRTPAPWARSFSSSTYAFDDLPPPPPPPLRSSETDGVQLSFAEHYDDDEESGAAGVQGAHDRGHEATPHLAPSIEAARGYGLSADAAQQLAREFSGKAQAAGSVRELGQSAAGADASFDGWGGTAGGEAPYGFGYPSSAALALAGGPSASAATVSPAPPSLSSAGLTSHPASSLAQLDTPAWGETNSDAPPLSSASSMSALAPAMVSFPSEPQRTLSLGGKLPVSLADEESSGAAGAAAAGGAGGGHADWGNPWG